MSLPVILGKYRTEVNQELKNILNPHSLPLYDMMRYHFGWIDKKGNPAEADSGKALRSALCLSSCEAVGGDYRQALPAAAALELVHNFSLIHDDIQDNDRERRHRPTVWSIWGKAQAINAGTAMRILANTAIQRLCDEAASLEKRALVNALMDDVTLRLIEGQYLDISYEGRFDIKVTDYLTMIGGKTASLIAGSMEMGALMGTNQSSTVCSIRETGWNLGLAFQIRDDILGIWGNQKETGKSTGNDIRRRKKSFPVIYALEQLEYEARGELVSLYKKSLMDEKVVNRVMQILESVDTQVVAQKQVDDYCHKASQALDVLPLKQSVKNEIAELVQFLTSRNY